jgi:hypothetical protein
MLFHFNYFKSFAFDHRLLKAIYMQKMITKLKFLSLFLFLLKCAHFLMLVFVLKLAASLDLQSKVFQAAHSKLFKTQFNVLFFYLKSPFLY